MNKIKVKKEAKVQAPCKDIPQIEPRVNEYGVAASYENLEYDDTGSESPASNSDSDSLTESVESESGPEEAIDFETKDMGGYNVEHQGSLGYEHHNGDSIPPPPYALTQSAIPHTHDEKYTHTPKSDTKKPKKPLWKTIKKHTLDKPENARDFAIAALAGGKVAKTAFMADSKRKQTKGKAKSSGQAQLMNTAVSVAIAAYAGGLEAKKTWDVGKEEKKVKKVKKDTKVIEVGSGVIGKEKR
ncbi:hypothetical protein P280DRAFT_554313 [Massarina eburnea CBS 473.64]|uniref:Uncharacterized protein n=1 Tax=Massarina eburnea CBS 473.64 TaxID=1395130 RepID=A0A6A6RI11_9PLEO|nr:hypothetical protein P280DRAFT_554313 [Massarina eburnea CBS 473.64]